LHFRERLLPKEGGHMRIVEDAVAPLAVTAVDQLTLELAPQYNEVASYVMTGGGYLAGLLIGGRWSDFLLRIGAISVPLTARAIRERVKAPPVASRAGATRLQFRNATNPGNVNRSYQPEFESVSPHAF